MRQTRRKCKRRTRRKCKRQTRSSCKRSSRKRCKRMTKCKVTLSTKNLNKMSKKDLLSIAGIGRKLACRIIQKRPFDNLEDLYSIEGFGDTAYTALKRRSVCVEDDTPLDLGFMDKTSPEPEIINLPTVSTFPTFPTFVSSPQEPVEKSSNCDVESLIGALKELSQENRNLQQQIKDCQEGQAQKLTQQEETPSQEIPTSQAIPLEIFNNPERCKQISLEILSRILNN